jgi:hypothetical protein
VLSVDEDETRSECPIFRQQRLAVGRRFLSHFGSLMSTLRGSYRGLRLSFSMGDGLLKLGTELCHLALKGGQPLLSGAQLQFNRSGPLSLFSQPHPCLLALANEVRLRPAACKERLRERIASKTYRTCRAEVEKSKGTANQPNPTPASGSSASAPQHRPKRRRAVARAIPDAARLDDGPRVPSSPWTGD